MDPGLHWLLQLRHLQPASCAEVTAYCTVLIEQDTQVQLWKQHNNPVMKIMILFTCFLFPLNATFWHLSLIQRNVCDKGFFSLILWDWFRTYLCLLSRSLSLFPFLISTELTILQVRQLSWSSEGKTDRKKEGQKAIVQKRRQCVPVSIYCTWMIAKCCRVRNLDLLPVYLGIIWSLNWVL